MTITIAHNVAANIANEVIAAAADMFDDTISTTEYFVVRTAPTVAQEAAAEAVTRARKDSAKIVTDMKSLAFAMTKPKSKHPMSADEAADVLEAMRAIRELFDFIEGSGAKAHVTRSVNLVLNDKVNRTEYNELVKHFAEVVVPAALETEQLKEVDAMEAAK